MKRDADHFGNQELILVYIARRLKEALALEALLTDSGVDYLVEADTYHGGVIFRSERVGAFFYVPHPAAGATRNLLTIHGYKPYEALG